MTALAAYDNDQAIKDMILEQLAAHRGADEIVKGRYWENGKGCAVGCTLHSFAVASGRSDFKFSEHAVYDDIFGPGGQLLGRLEDQIFEGLPNDAARFWPERFAKAFAPGRDYSHVGWEFLNWLLAESAAASAVKGAWSVALAAAAGVASAVSCAAILAAAARAAETKRLELEFGVVNSKMADKLIELIEAVS